MSSHDPGRRSPQLAVISAIICLSIALGGCVRPLYGGARGAGLRAELAAIRVEPVKHRIGHYLANELVFSLNGTGSSPAKKYRLVVSLTERVQSPVVDTISGRATAATVVVDAHYRLIPVGAEAPIASGVAFVAASYDRTSQRFANIRANRDAEIRAAKALAEQIHVRLASHLASRIQ